MEFGFNYIGVRLPKMTAGDVEEIITDLIPRKVVLASPDEADAIVPELLAFWEYLKREYRLPKADSIIEYLREIQPDLPRMVNDPSRFGIAKSLFTMGNDTGFDMTTDKGMTAFMEDFNARQEGHGTHVTMPFDTLSAVNRASGSRSNKQDAGRRSTKRKGNAAKKARRTNRKKRK